MADSLPNAYVDGGVWTDAYTLPNITLPVGTNLDIQNVSDNVMYVWEGATQPALEGYNGRKANPGLGARVTGSPSGVWLFFAGSGGNVSIQEAV